MNVYELVYIISLLAVIGFFIVKFYNVIRKGQLYTFATALLIFGGNLIAWFFILVVFLNNPTIYLYNITFILVGWTLGIQLLFLVIEMFFGLASTTTTIEAYHAKK